MAQTITDLIENWTSPIRYTLLSDGTAEDLTGKTVIPVCEDNRGIVVSSSGDITIEDSTAGEVAYNPNSTDTLVASKSPYTLQFSVFDGNNKLAHWPSMEPIALRVRPRGSL